MVKGNGARGPLFLCLMGLGKTMLSCKAWSCWRRQRVAARVEPSCSLVMGGTWAEQFHRAVKPRSCPLLGISWRNARG